MTISTIRRDLLQHYLPWLTLTQFIKGFLSCLDSKDTIFIYLYMLWSDIAG